MSKKDQLLDGLFDNYNEQQFVELQGQYNILAEWMKKEFPDVEFRVDWHLNRIKGYLEVKATILTDPTMSINDRLLKANLLRFSEKQWFDKAYMSKIISGVVPGLKEHITNSINQWYRIQKAKDSIS